MPLRRTLQMPRDMFHPLVPAVRSVKDGVASRRGTGHHERELTPLFHGAGLEFLETGFPFWMGGVGGGVFGGCGGGGSGFHYFFDLRGHVHPSDVLGVEVFAVEDDAVGGGGGGGGSKVVVG